MQIRNREYLREKRNVDEKFYILITSQLLRALKARTIFQSLITPNLFRPGFFFTRSILPDKLSRIFENFYE